MLKAAAVIAREHGLQLWDAVICAAASEAGAAILLTEDLQDGRRLDSLLLINPFKPDNAAAIEAALGA